jgi:hypothetical protein
MGPRHRDRLGDPEPGVRQELEEEAPVCRQALQQLRDRCAKQRDQQAHKAEKVEAKWTE